MFNREIVLLCLFLLINLQLLQCIEIKCISHFHLRSSSYIFIKKCMFNRTNFVLQALKLELINL